MKRKFTSKFKVKVAIEALKERETMAELAKRFKLYPNQISQWKRDFLERADQAFEGPSSAPRTDFKDLEKERDERYKKVGELQMDNDFLKKSLGKLGM
jgi:transposase